MTSVGRGARPRTEAELVARTATAFARDGFRPYVNPDGLDYFDLVVRRGVEVGLVEAKLGQPRALLVQALRRRPWGDWVAVVVPSRRTADRLAASTAGRRAGPVGVYVLDGDRLVTVRPPERFVAPDDADDPFAALRDRFRRVLDRRDAGELPDGIPWDGLFRELRRASAGRGFREWRLDEPGPDRTAP